MKAEFIGIQKFSPGHAPTAAEIHAEGQPGTFLSLLGEKFLTALYAQIASSSLGFGYVALLNGEVIGFVVATEDTGQLFKEVIGRGWLNLTWPLFESVIRRPALLSGVFQSLFYPGREGNEAELLSIGVRAGRRSQGIGGRLMEALVEECQARAIPALTVTVDAANEGAIRFYRRHGFFLRRTFALYGRKMHSYVLNLA